MKRKSADEIPGEMLAAYLEGELTPSEKAMIDAEIADSTAVRRRLERLCAIRDALCRPASGLGEVDLVPDIRRAIEAPRPAAPWRRGLRSWYAGLVAVASCMLVLGGAMLLRPASSEFRPKSGAAAEGRERWAGIQVYRVDDGHAPERVARELSAGDGLLFSYTNLGRDPFDYLMVFGVDARGEVRWFYPAYVQEGTNPTSIRIGRRHSNVPLPELIRHAWPPGPLAIHALFTGSPLAVLQVEALLRQPHRGDEPLSLPGASDHVVRVTVSEKERAAP